MRWRSRGFLSDVDQRVLTCALQNMRMSCNSTYLLDHETDHGTKVDELMTLLEECLEQPDAKVVVFSQWVRTHELIIRRLRARDWSHVLFHGGVPSERRPALIDRFHGRSGLPGSFFPPMRAASGLNLQHAAATIVNMDPAVEPCRSGAAHRARASTGPGAAACRCSTSSRKAVSSKACCPVLAFKKALFEGVLDGGESDVFLQGTRLAKFMSAVDEVTGSMGVPEAAAPASAERGPVAASDASPVLGFEEAPVAAHTRGAEGFEAMKALAPDPWAALVDAGLQLLDAISPRDASSSNGLGASIERDHATGRDTLRIPLPQPETLARLVQAVGGLLACLPREEDRPQL